MKFIQKQRILSEKFHATMTNFLSRKISRHYFYKRYMHPPAPPLKDMPVFPKDLPQKTLPILSKGLTVEIFVNLFSPSKMLSSNYNERCPCWMQCFYFNPVAYCMLRSMRMPKTSMQITLSYPSPQISYSYVVHIWQA